MVVQLCVPYLPRVFVHNVDFPGLHKIGDCLIEIPDYFVFFSRDNSNIEVCFVF